MRISQIIAMGGSAIQGGIILLGLLMALLAIPFACYSVFRKKEGRSLVSVVVCALALLVSIVTAAVFGLPHDWTYWGAYLPWIPLLISASATLLTLLKRKQNQRPESNAVAGRPLHIVKVQRPLKILSMAVAVISIVIGSWYAINRHRHRILVILPDGTAAQNPSVILDYDPVSYDYHPQKISGSYGTVFISSRIAYGRGWEFMHIMADQNGKRYYAKRYPNQCEYPMRVVLDECPPVPPSKNAVEQAIDLWEIYRKVRP